MLACSGRTQPSRTPAVSEVATPETTADSPPAANSPTPSPTASPVPGEPVPLRLGSPVPLPPGVVLYAFDGRWEGPTPAIRRYYRAPSGEFVSETLLESHFDRDESNVRGIDSLARSVDGRQLVAGLCHGYCYGDVSPVTIVRSFDGGVTWETLKTIEPTGYVLAATTDLVLTQRSDGAQNFEWFALQGLEELPVVTPVVWKDGFRAADTSQGIILYSQRNGHTDLLRLDGTSVASVRAPAPGALSSTSTVLTGSSGDLYLLTDSGEGVFLGTITVTAVTRPLDQRSYRYTNESGLDGFWPVAWLSAIDLLGRGSFQRSRVGAGDTDWTTGIPAIFNLTTGVVSPIADFMGLSLGKAGGPVPFAADFGSFVQVAGTGDCLNIREQPSTSAPARGCVPDRVLLRTVEPAVQAEGRAWREVVAPDGTQGWTAEEFLAPATIAPR